jgi:hypothetical protein
MKLLVLIWTIIITDVGMVVLAMRLRQGCTKNIAKLLETYWLEAAEYDLESARVMLNGGRYMYVAFMSQQAIEKLTKGMYLLDTDKESPRSHNI